MKRPWLKRLTILLVAMAGFTAEPTFGQAQQKEPGLRSAKENPQRPIPFRGIIGKTDPKNQTFTLANKSNQLIRTFKVTKETKFERDGIPAKFDLLRPNLQVRGSCFKTGERQYTAKLVRWTTQKQERNVKESSKKN
ncbi:MAG: hypothetical protein M2R45_03988 [Verrucomicrobia subdivision 3 bacterium]|nr:hypothetical protein [Limisphaerales bacterium]MCS1415492.1 hypothetical protein [Limisphaerales bacterium]